MGWGRMVDRPQPTRPTIRLSDGNSPIDVGRFKTVTMFILAVFAATIVVNGLARLWVVTHPDGIISRGLVGTGVV